MVIAVLVAGAAGRPALATPSFPQPTTHVADFAGVIDGATKSEIDGWLTELEQKTGAQLIVMTVKSTQGEPIETFALAVAEQWKLGRKGHDDGALIVVAVGDRKYRTEVGYGLEGVLPDGYVGSVQREVFPAYFRKGQYAEGLREAALRFARRISEAKQVQISGLPAAAAPRRQSGGKGVGIPCFFFLIVSLVIVAAIRRSVRGGSYRGGRWRGRRSRWGIGDIAQAMILNQMLGGGRSSGWGSGSSSSSSWSSSSSSSFGGGGGGSFGGGGASGGW